MNSKLLQKGPVAEVVRLATGGLRVNIKRPEYATFRLASGANLSRVLRRIGSEVDFLMITSFRAGDEDQNKVWTPRTKSQNERLFTRLPGELRSLLGSKRVGAYWLVAHWTTCTVPLNGAPLSECTALGGHIADSLEYSWLFTRDDPKVSGEAWLEAAKTLAKRYDQDSFVIRLDGETTLRGSTGDVWKTLSTDQAVEEAWKNLTEIREKEPYYGYSELRKVRERGRIQPIVLPESRAAAYRVTGTGEPHTIEFFVAEPHGNSSSALFAAIGAEPGLR